MTQLNDHYVPHQSWFADLRRWVFNCPNHTIVASRARVAYMKKNLVAREAEGLVIAIRRSHERQA